MNELEKSKIEPVPGGSVEAPNPPELIDLEVRFCNSLNHVIYIHV